jgi:hypothetical protein
LTTLGPCAPWTDAELVTACEAYADVESEALETPITVASELLYNLSGMQFPGTCTGTVRPVDRAFLIRATDGTYEIPYGSFRWTALGHAYAFDTQTVPIKSVTEVLVDGVAMDLANVIVQDERWIIRRDGQAWPVAQRLNLPTTEVGTWSLTYTYGDAPPASGVLAASKLAGELALSCGSESQRKCCRLSRRVQQVTRQGMSMILLDPFQFLDKGRLGIMEIDAFLMTFNPEGLQGEPVFGSPDLGPTFVQQTWPTT